MKNYIIDHDEFQLPFLFEPGYVLENAVRDVETMLDMLTDDAVIIGRTNAEINNWTSWETDDIYIMLPSKDNEWDWILFRISWDDNWSCWAWTSDCRIKGDFRNIKEPAVIMISECWKLWGIDLSDSENEDYVKMLNRVKRMKL